MEEKIKESIKKVFVNVLAIDKKDFSFEKSHGDFEKWDSLNHMNLVSALEEEFKISLSVDEISEMDSVKKVLEIVGKHVKK